MVVKNKQKTIGIYVFFSGVYCESRNGGRRKTESEEGKEIIAKVNSQSK